MCIERGLIQGTNCNTSKLKHFVHLHSYFINGLSKNAITPQKEVRKQYEMHYKQ